MVVFNFDLTNGEPPARRAQTAVTDYFTNKQLAVTDYFTSRQLLLLAFHVWQRKTAVTAYFRSKQLLLSAFCTAVQDYRTAWLFSRKSIQDHLRVSPPTGGHMNRKQSVKLKSYPGYILDPRPQDVQFKSHSGYIHGSQTQILPRLHSGSQTLGVKPESYTDYILGPRPRGVWSSNPTPAKYMDPRGGGGGKKGDEAHILPRLHAGS